MKSLTRKQTAGLAAILTKSIIDAIADKHLTPELMIELTAKMHTFKKIYRQLVEHDDV